MAALFLLLFYGVYGFCLNAFGVKCPVVCERKTTLACSPRKF